MENYWRFLRAVGEAAVDREKLEDLFIPHILRLTASALQQHWLLDVRHDNDYRLLQE